MKKAQMHGGYKSGAGTGFMNAVLNRYFYFW